MVSGDDEWVDAGTAAHTALRFDLTANDLPASPHIPIGPDLSTNPFQSSLCLGKGIH